MNDEHLLLWEVLSYEPAFILKILHTIEKLRKDSFFKVLERKFSHVTKCSGRKTWDWR